MKIKTLFIILAAVLGSTAAIADTKTTTYVVNVNYDGTKATVTIPDAVKNYVTCESGESSIVKLIQTSTDKANPGEIIYALKGETESGMFYLTGEYKATLRLDGVTICNPDSSAIHVKNGKRIKVSMTANTVNTLSDGVADTTSKGCFHSKGHTEFVGRGTLNISSKFRHAIFSKEYVEIKNCTLNITGAKKDGIHCQEYLLMNSGTVNISGVEDDGIQVELKDSVETGMTKDHEDENSGNLYMVNGTLTISDVGDKCIKTYGTITYTGGKQVFDTANVKENAKNDDTPDDVGVISALRDCDGPSAIYDLSGRRMPNDACLPKGIYIVKEGDRTRKILVK